jgi:hypothetical protein
VTGPVAAKTSVEGFDTLATATTKLSGGAVTIRVEREGDSIWLSAPPQRKDQVKQIPGSRHNSRRQLWELPLSWATCVIARGVFGAQLEVGSELVAWAREEKARIDAVMVARAEAVNSDA